MSIIKLCTLAMFATSSLAACSSHEQANTNNKTNMSQIKESSSLIRSIKPSHSKAVVGQVTSIIMQDREQQKVTIMAENGKTFTASISKSSFGKQNAYQMQKLAIGDYVEVTGEQVQVKGESQLVVSAMPYVLREIIVADHQVDCVGVGPQSCWLVKIAGQASSDWEYRYSAIEGFDYQPNYEYTLLIKKTSISNPPVDASSIRSELIEVIEKKRTKN